MNDYGYMVRKSNLNCQLMRFKVLQISLAIRNSFQSNTPKNFETFSHVLETPFIYYVRGFLSVFDLLPQCKRK